MNHKKILIGLGIFLAIAVVLLFVVKSNKDKAANNTPTTTPNTAPTTTTANTTTTTPPILQGVVSDFPIVYMQKSNAAKQLQKALGVAPDGKIGDITLKALNQTLKLTGKDAYTIRFSIPNQATLNAIINQVTAKNKVPDTLTTNTGFRF
jgi:hypothetical protein